MLRSNSKVWGNPSSQYWRRRKGYGGKDLQKKKVLSREWKSEGWLNANNNKYEC